MFVIYISSLLNLFTLGNYHPKENIIPQIESHDTTSVFRRYDLAKKMLLDWNAAISNNEPDKLNAYYAETVECYTKTISKQEVIENKKKWLAAHVGYKQKLDNIQLYYYDSDSAVTLIIAEFIKICIDANITTKVNSYLYIVKIGNEWKIIKESDDATEIVIAKKAAVSTLPKGKHTFYLGYWEDTRNIEAFAHDQVPYNYTLNLNVGAKITGEFLYYSGTMRSITNYLIVGGNITDGILDLSVIYNGNGEYTVEEYLQENEGDISKAEHWKYKIIDGKELMCINKEGMAYAKKLIYEFRF